MENPRAEEVNKERASAMDQSFYVEEGASTLPVAEADSPRGSASKATGHQLEKSRVDSGTGSAGADTAVCDFAFEQEAS
jgi:hypothetical protein